MRASELIDLSRVRRLTGVDLGDPEVKVVDRLAICATSTGEREECVVVEERGDGSRRLFCCEEPVTVLVDRAFWEGLDEEGRRLVVAHELLEAAYCLKRLEELRRLPQAERRAFLESAEDIHALAERRDCEAAGLAGGRCREVKARVREAGRRAGCI